MTRYELWTVKKDARTFANAFTFVDIVHKIDASSKESLYFHEASLGKRVDSFFNRDNAIWLDAAKEQCFIGTRVGDRGAAESRVNQKELKNGQNMGMSKLTLIT
jgi:hypothetical protein